MLILTRRANESVKIGGKGDGLEGPVTVTVLGIKGGQVYGKSNATASEPEENALGVEDWATTIYKCLGITADKELMAPGARPIEIVNGGKVRKDLLA